MTKIDELEIVVQKDKVDIWYQGRHYASCAIREGGQFVLSKKRDDIELTNQPITYPNLRLLDVWLLTRDQPLEGAVAIPKTRKRPLRASELVQAPRRSKKPHGGGAADSISEHVRDQVLNAVLDSLLDYPDQSASFRASETARIAKKYSEPKMAVAGVRAALTKGVYGDFRRKLSQRQRERRQK